MQLDKPQVKANPNLKDFWYSDSGKIKYYRYRVLYGGRMSGKSYDTAVFLLRLSTIAKIKVLNTRLIQNKIEDSVYSLYKKLILEDKRLQQQFTILKDKIINNKTGSVFIFKGLLRNIEEIKGLEDIDICWIEEAQTLLEDTFKILDPTIRKEGSFFIFTFNPKRRDDFIYKEFIVKNKADTIKRKINYDENPYLSNTMKKLVTNAKKELSEDEFNHIFLGELEQNNDDSFIKEKYIRSAIGIYDTLQIKRGIKRYVGYDIADSGNDTSVIALVEGGELTYIEEWKNAEDELEEAHEKVFNFAKKHKATIIYDGIGVGASAGSTFKRLNRRLRIHKVKYKAFIANGKVVSPNKYYRVAGDSTKIKNIDYFANVKSQMWKYVADCYLNAHRAVNGKEYDESAILSIHPDTQLLDKAIYELSTPKKEEDSTGRLMVQSKKSMAKEGIPSPNIADAIIMGYAPFVGLKMDGFKNSL